MLDHKYQYFDTSFWAEIMEIIDKIDELATLAHTGVQIGLTSLSNTMFH